VVDGTVFTADWTGRVWAFRPGPPAESGGHTWRYVLGGILLVIAAAVFLTRRRRR
jgi:MYXO-CTERM domain-containing protein